LSQWAPEGRGPRGCLAQMVVRAYASDFLVDLNRDLNRFRSMI